VKEIAFIHYRAKRYITECDNAMPNMGRQGTRRLSSVTPASPNGRRSQKGGGNLVKLGKRTLVIGRVWATSATMILSTMTVRLVRILLVIWFACADGVALRKSAWHHAELWRV